MATTISIRNLTATPLELTSIERFQGRRIQTGNVVSNLTGHITGFLNATQFSAHQTVAHGDATHKDDVGIHIKPFNTASSNLKPPESRQHEVVRLTFRDDAKHRYEVDIPSPSRRSSVMKKVDADAQHDLTAVYIPKAAFIAVLSSANLNAWMSQLHDEWPLPILSIPGTHNSPTCHPALPSVRCQAVGVTEQLRNGVRFLDIRVSVNLDNDELALVHGAFPVCLTGIKYFREMVNSIYKFLDENPRETILMSIKREGTGRGNDGHLGNHLKHSYVDKRRSRWWTEPKIPTLGGARGRIVIIRRFGLNDDMKKNCWDGRGWGIDAEHWPDNCEDGKVSDGQIRVQDFYEITESQNIDKKIGFTRGQLERAAEQNWQLSHTGPLPSFFVNFLSASNFFNATCWPERIAAKVNPSVIEYLCTHHGEDGKGPRKLKIGSASTGIVVTDWVGANGDWDLIRCIVGMNARLQLKK